MNYRCNDLLGIRNPTCMNAINFYPHSNKKLLLIEEDGRLNPDYIFERLINLRAFK